MPSLNKVFFIGPDKVGGIIEIFDIVLPIPFWLVSSLAYKVFDSETPTFYDCIFIEKVLYFKRFIVIGVPFYKYRGRIL